jgi:hypothetical protein
LTARLSEIYAIVMQHGNTDAERDMQNLVFSRGVSSVPELPPESYGEVLAEAEGILARVQGGA